MSDLAKAMMTVVLEMMVIALVIGAVVGGTIAALVMWLLR